MTAAVTPPLFLVGYRWFSGELVFEAVRPEDCQKEAVHADTRTAMRVATPEGGV